MSTRCHLRGCLRSIHALTRANRQGYLLRGYLRSQAELPQPKLGTYQEDSPWPKRRSLTGGLTLAEARCLTGGIKPYNTSYHSQ
ncbi:hypothetical protein V6N13_020088 [Hibiscus sabdariffa]